ncbi:hypothetical protein CSKR_114417, partial [Clonorchis sinensis]
FNGFQTIGVLIRLPVTETTVVYDNGSLAPQPKVLPNSAPTDWMKFTTMNYDKKDAEDCRRTRHIAHVSSDEKSPRITPHQCDIVSYINPR